jgi:hypothetical protein
MILIIFVPAYDISNRANLKIAAELIKSCNCVAIFEDEATQCRLLTELKKSNTPLLVMSHGIPEALKAQDGQIALSTNDVNLLNGRTVYAYACHTAKQLGKNAAQQGSIWWGYSDAISCAIDSPELISIFTGIFVFIRDNFHTATSQHDRQRFLEELKNLCETAEEQVDMIDADTEITEIMEVYRTFRHLWDLLRIWVPGADRPEQHPHSTSPSLPW